jgi:cyclopropane fatty-acyl-phospholipid synthase-like methyltransferase
VEEHATAAPPEDHATVSHRFDDIERWVAVWDDPQRDAWQKPEAVVEALGLQPGMVVADIGAGTGYFNPHLAAAVGPEGKVIAVDIEPALVAHMTARASEEGTPQVEPRLAEPDNPKLAPAEVDRVLLVDTYHHIDGRVDYFGALRAALRPSGRLVIVDFKKGDIPVGPPERHRLDTEAVEKELMAAGWRFLGSPDVLPYQYVLVWEVVPD